MKRMLFVCLASSSVLFGCPDEAGDYPDASVNPQADAATHADATTNADAVANADASAEADANGNEDASLPDAAAPGCTSVARIDSVVADRFGPMWTFDPTSATPTVLMRREEAGEFTAWGVGRVSAANGYEWHAQISHFTMFDSHRVEAALIDPIDDASYVAVELQVSTSTRTRFYNADGTLFKELTSEGAPGEDIVGRSRQSNFFLVKYSASGQILWLTRFGPNSPGDDIAGHLPAIGFAGDRVRVFGSVEDAGPIVFAAGQPSQFIYDAPAATAFWAEFLRSDGSYVANSARFIEGEAANASSSAPPNGVFSTNANGESAFAGVLFRSQGMGADFTIGAGAPNSLTVTTTQASPFFAKIGADGAPIFAGRASGANGFGEPRAFAISEAGDVIAGGQFRGSAGTALFYGTNTSIPLMFGEQQSYLVAYGSDGEPRWAKVLTGVHRNAVSEINVFGDGVYLMGTGSPADLIFGIGEPNETPLPGAGGYFLAKFSLATGAFQWVRAFSPTMQGVHFADAYQVLVRGGELVVPSLFTGLTINDGTGEEIFPGFGGLSLVRFAPGDGEVLGCGAFGIGMGAYSLF